MSEAEFSNVIRGESVFTALVVVTIPADDSIPPDQNVLADEVGSAQAAVAAAIARNCARIGSIPDVQVDFTPSTSTTGKLTVSDGS